VRPMARSAPGPVVGGPDHHRAGVAPQHPPSVDHGDPVELEVEGAPVRHHHAVGTRWATARADGLSSGAVGGRGPGGTGRVRRAAGGWSTRRHADPSRRDVFQQVGRRRGASCGPQRSQPVHPAGAAGEHAAGVLGRFRGRARGLTIQGTSSDEQTPQPSPPWGQWPSVRSTVVTLSPTTGCDGACRAMIRHASSVLPELRPLPPTRSRSGRKTGPLTGSMGLGRLGSRGKFMSGASYH
jgi:hypothetical protein